MAGFSTLEIGKRALLAQKFGLDVTSNNIANVNTPNFSRREAVLSETDPRYTTAGFIGTGAVAQKLKTFREETFDKEIRYNISRKSAYALDEKIYSKIEGVLAEPTESGLSEQVSKFLGAFDDIAASPENVAHREFVLGLARGLTERLNKMSNEFYELREDVATDINYDVDAANKLIEQVAELNGEIAATNAKGKGSAQTLVDEREEKLEQLSELVGVGVSRGKFDSVNVHVNGINVITGIDYNSLKAVETANQTTGERTIRIYNVNEKEEELYSIDVDSGEIASLKDFFNETLDPENSGSEISVVGELNRFVNEFASRINEETMQGYGMNDAGTTPPGRNFFDPVAGPITAGNISLAIADPTDIPLAQISGENGDAEIARRIGRIAQDSAFLDGSDPAEFFGNFIGKVSSESSRAVDGNKTSSIVFEQMQSQRESLIGVNLDEEAINLIKFQKSFEAASRVVNTTNELLVTLINLGR